MRAAVRQSLVGARECECGMSAESACAGLYVRARERDGSVRTQMLVRGCRGSVLGRKCFRVACAVTVALCGDARGEAHDAAWWTRGLGGREGGQERKREGGREREGERERERERAPHGQGETLTAPCSVASRFVDDFSVTSPCAASSLSSARFVPPGMRSESASLVSTSPSPSIISCGSRAFSSSDMPGPVLSSRALRAPVHACGA